ncbi:MAG: hypothetical protein AAGA50_30005 [Pseudomonadota bacterium]
MTNYRQILQAIDEELDEWIPQAVLQDAVQAVETEADLQAYIQKKSSHSSDVAPYSGYDLYTLLIAILVTTKAVWSTAKFADEVTSLLLDPNKQLALAEKIVLRLRQAGMDYSAEKVQSWINVILDKMTRAE